MSGRGPAHRQAIVGLCLLIGLLFVAPAPALLPPDPDVAWAGLPMDRRGFDELLDITREVHLTGEVPGAAWVVAANGALRTLRPRLRLTARDLVPTHPSLRRARPVRLSCLPPALTLLQVPKARRPDSVRKLRAWRKARRALSDAERAAFARVRFGKAGLDCVMAELERRLPRQTGLPAGATVTTELSRKAWRLAANHLLKAMDPHAAVLPNRLLERLDAESGGDKRVGIGLEVAVRRGAVVVVRVVAGGPAARAGIRPGDVLSHLDGRSLAGDSAQHVDRALSGKAGSSVTLHLTRGRRRLRLRLTRQAVRRSRVTGRRLGPRDEVLVVRLPVFASGAAKDLRVLIDQLLRSSKRRAKALVLDLRGNTGGWVDEATAIADLFLDKGEIVRVKTRGEADEVHVAKPDAGDVRLPMALLVDSRCRSSCELVSDALQAHGRAVVLGAQTYGKGTVQGLFEARRGPWSLIVTIARYHGPDSGSVQARGVRPDLPLAGVATGGFRESDHRGAVDAVAGDPRRRKGPSAARTARLERCRERPPTATWWTALAKRDRPLAEAVGLALGCRRALPGLGR